MKRFLPILFFLSLSCSSDKILPSPTRLIQVPDELIEISGIIPNNTNTIYAHNDSGDDPHIYDVSLLERKINKTILLHNADAVDWEDITEDETHIFIGDFGNNSGGRENLVIYKIKKSDLVNQDSIAAETIAYHYPEQIDFSLRNDHNFDCEAIITFHDELFLFTKNRGDNMTNWYSLPKSTGIYPATLKGNFNTEGLITAATTNPSQDVISLLGYTNNNSEFDSFIWLFYDFSSTDIFDGKQRKIDLNITEQSEALTFRDNTTLLFAHEKETGSEAGWIYELDIECFLE